MSVSVQVSLVVAVPPRTTRAPVRRVTVQISPSRSWLPVSVDTVLVTEPTEPVMALYGVTEISGAVSKSPPVAAVLIRTRLSPSAKAT